MNKHVPQEIQLTHTLLFPRPGTLWPKIQEKSYKLWVIRRNNDHLATNPIWPQNKLVWFGYSNKTKKKRSNQSVKGGFVYVIVFSEYACVTNWIIIIIIHHSYLLTSYVARRRDNCHQSPIMFILVSLVLVVAIEMDTTQHPIWPIDEEKSLKMLTCFGVIVSC